MITVTLKNGLSRNITTTVDQGTTLGDAVEAFGQALNLPENYRAVRYGSVIYDEAILSDGDVVVFEKQASTKNG